MIPPHFPLSLSLSSAATNFHAIFKFHLDGQWSDERGGIDEALLKILAVGRDLNFIPLVAPAFRAARF